MSTLVAGPAALLRPRRKAAISLTALIDVVFILLMFFMLTSSFIHQKAMNINIPAPSAAQSSDDVPQLLVLKDDGSFSFFAARADATGQDAPSLNGLMSAISQQQPLVVLPHSQVSLQRMVETLRSLKQNGIQAVLGQTLSDPDGAQQP